MNNYKIWHIINRLTASSFLFDWASMLYKRGWDIAVLPVEGHTNQLKPDEFGAPVIEIGQYRRGDPRIILEIRKKIRDNNVDLIHVHQNYSGGVASLAALGNKNVRVINTEHALHQGFKKLGLLLNSVNLFRGDYHCFNSNSTLNSLNWLERILIRNNPKQIIYNGVPVQEIENERTFKEVTYRKWGLSKDNIYIGKIATLKKQKDHSVLLKAIQLLAKKHSKTRLLLIGDGPLYKKLKYQVKKLGITDYVYFMGLLKRREVYRILHILTISVITSRWEGFCNAVVESMAAGTPVVISDIPTFKEVFGNAALYFRKSDPVDLAKKLEILIRNKDMYNRYANLADDPCCQIYNIEDTIEKYEEAYRLLLRKQFKSTLEKQNEIYLDKVM